MKSAEIRDLFLSFFEEKGHTRAKSSSLIPAADPTLLFTNAGMVQFKDCFLGTRDFGFRRATTSQKCVRAGGKHNDLENVGYTPRHHTFFEMLGNFSFGDYFKKEAIAFAWELLTERLKLPKDKLRITVFRDDDEAFDLWVKQGIDPKMIERLGEADNFWAMGDTGPCGPCSEIYYDWGPERAMPNGGGTPGTDSKRFVEIWNLVFMQYNRSADGVLAKLPKPSVDTGAGLERVSAAMQGKYSNYDTDLFVPILEKIAARVKRKYGGEDEDSTAMRVIADHLRSVTMLLTDGVVPSNEGRGYVVRRIIRRAVRYGKRLGQETPFLHELVGAVVASLGSVYPELKEKQKLVETQLREEEEKFHETLHRGMGVFEDALKAMGGKKELPGEIAFRLYDTFGFPFDLIELLCREKNLTVDTMGFDERMEKQRELSQGLGKASTGARGKAIAAADTEKATGSFIGYDKTEGDATLVFAADAEGASTKKIEKGQRGFLTFASTPFYAEGGGQAGDRGTIRGSNGLAKVIDTVKSAFTHIHEVEVTEGELTVGETAHLAVDSRQRRNTASNHTATHLLHSALRRVLGDRVRQAGSLVDATRLRFDFTFPRGLTPEERTELERLVNEQVRLDQPVSKREMPYDDAIKAGAIAFFDEKYGDSVRVIRVGGEAVEPFSVELCGGTHLDHLAPIVVFRILSESSVASGVRRIEAVTGDAALALLLERDRLLTQVERALNAFDAKAVERVEKVQADLTKAVKENEQLKTKLASAQAGGGGGGGLHDKAKKVGDLSVVAERLRDVDGKSLRGLVDQVRDKLQKNAVVCLAAESDGKAFLCLGITKDLTERLDASALLRPLAEALGGSGGGRKDFAQAGGGDPSRIDAVLEQFRTTVR